MRYFGHIFNICSDTFDIFEMLGHLFRKQLLFVLIFSKFLAQLKSPEVVNECS